MHNLPLLPYILPAALALLLHSLAAAHYGPFRDEMYYLECSHHLAWGYVDHPPFSVFLLRLWTAIFGENELAIRSLSCLASVVSTLAVSRLTAQLGGSRTAIALAGIAMAASPVMQVIGLLYSPNTLDPLLWAFGVSAWLRCLSDRTSLPRWLLLGIVLGIACLNRLSGLWLISALIAASAFTGPLTFSPPVVGAAAVTALAMMSPWVAWEASRHWPTLEFLKNAQTFKMNRVGPIQFVLTQLAVMNPLGAPVWLTGIAKGLQDKDKSGVWRGLAVGFLLVAAFLIVNGKSRENYLAPAYVFVLPLGAIALSRSSKAAQIYGAILLSSGALLGLICLPILPKETLARVLRALPNPPSAEKGPKSVLQGLSDTSGWPEMTQAVAQAYRSLPPDEKSRTAIIAANYGEASALRMFGPDFRLRPAISGHNQFWLWGPGPWDGSSAILLGDVGPLALSSFREVKLLGQVNAPWATPEEAYAPIRLARGLRIPIAEFWNRIKHYE